MVADLIDRWVEEYESIPEPHITDAIFADAPLPKPDPEDFFWGKCEEELYGLFVARLIKDSTIKKERK